MLEGMAEGIGAWLQTTGPEAEIVFSSRVRLARNLRGIPFSSQATTAQQREVVSLLKVAAKRVPVLADARVIDSRDITATERQFLQERYLISTEFAQGGHDRAVLVGPREGLSVMVNEADHVRIQALRSGLQLTDAWEALDAVDNALDAQLDFAYDEALGFLTANPSNVGTALRASVMVHLPALSLTRKISDLLGEAEVAHLAVRGLHAEGSEAIGDFFQISNQVTLGLSEAELLTQTEQLVRDLVTHERAAREQLLRERRVFLEDRVGRAMGILTHAQMIGVREAMERLSDVRLGIATGLVPQITVDALNERLIEIQPAHLQKRTDEHLDPEARDVARAALIRKTLHCGEG